MTLNAVPMRSAAGVLAPVVDVSAAAGSTTTSLVCYFQKGEDVTWQWGLKSDNNWYKVAGRWISTPYTGLTKFFTDAGVDELAAAAENARKYHTLNGYTLRAMCAADSAAGYSYPIVSRWVELYPKY